MRYIIAPLDIKDDEFKVYKYLWSKCDFKTMICEYTERNILIDIKADFSRKRLQNIFKMFIDMNLFVILEKGTKNKPSKLFINKEILWSQIRTESEPNGSQINVDNTNFTGIKEPNRSQIGATKVPSIKEVKNKEKNIYSDSDVDEIRKLYKGTKVAKSKDKLIKLIKKYSKDEIIRTVKRYNSYVENERKNGFEKLKYKNESTFWNGGYLDYLDCEYNKNNQSETKKEVKENLPDDFKPDWE